MLSSGGEFYGLFPSGNNTPGGNFVARFAAFHNKTTAPLPALGFTTPLVLPGTPTTGTVDGAVPGTTANAEKARAVSMAAPIASRQVKFAKAKAHAVHSGKG